MLFYILFVCKRVLYCCHRVSTQLKLTNVSYLILSNAIQHTEKFQYQLLSVQPAIFLTTISLSLTFIDQIVSYIYCFGSFTKMMRNMLLEVCWEWLHLVIALQEGGSASTTMRQVTVQIISDSTCNSAYASVGGITPRMICAGVSGGGRDACQVTGSW